MNYEVLTRTIRASPTPGGRRDNTSPVRSSTEVSLKVKQSGRGPGTRLLGLPWKRQQSTQGHIHARGRLGAFLNSESCILNTPNTGESQNKDAERSPAKRPLGFLTLEVHESSDRKLLSGYLSTGNGKGTGWRGDTV